MRFLSAEMMSCGPYDEVAALPLEPLLEELPELVEVAGALLVPEVEAVETAGGVVVEPAEVVELEGVELELVGLEVVELEAVDGAVLSDAAAAPSSSLAALPPW
jgi:hypothetical protein